ncbi:hypothetical protein [Bacillus sp. 03113]|uniref:hypothetical protein n=1 Tax=Bacillus sp. 03113 TaxID=2578211 RepID=UPI0011430E4E|nr:hypothetical protein [Bacillus sp. 03113]
MVKGKNDIPDFKELNDRIIAEPSKGPFIAIKTNLDSSGEKDNPYASEQVSDEENEKLHEYFEDDQIK